MDWPDEFMHSTDVQARKLTCNKDLMMRQWKGNLRQKGQWHANAIETLNKRRRAQGTLRIREDLPLWIVVLP